MSVRKIDQKEAEDFFIVINQYCEQNDGNRWPHATIVLSAVDSNLEGPTSHNVYYNESRGRHAESFFIDDLQTLLQKEGVTEITATLVQNYSPCNANHNDIERCADKILKFMKDNIEKKNVSFSLTIQFANFYKCYYKKEDEKWKKSPHINGLVKLRKNGVALQLLKGEEGWNDFFNKFVDVSDEDKTRLRERAALRIDRENVDEIILNYVETKASAEAKVEEHVAEANVQDVTDKLEKMTTKDEW